MKQEIVIKILLDFYKLPRNIRGWQKGFQPNNLSKSVYVNDQTDLGKGAGLMNFSASPYRLKDFVSYYLFDICLFRY